MAELSYWDYPSEDPVDISDIPIEILEEHIATRRAHLEVMDPEEKDDAMQEIEGLQQLFDLQTAGQQQQHLQRSHSSQPLFNTDAVAFHTSHRSPNNGSGSSSSEDDSLHPLMGRDGNGDEPGNGYRTNGAENCYGANGVADGYRANGVRNGLEGPIMRKRRWNMVDADGNFGADHETKSPRYTPSPQTFATPLSESPTGNGYVENNGNELLKLFRSDYSTEAPTRNQILSDAMMAQHMQDMINQGIPPSNVFQRTEVNHWLPTAVPSPSLGIAQSHHIIDLTSGDGDEPVLIPHDELLPFGNLTPDYSRTQYGRDMPLDSLPWDDQNFFKDLSSSSLEQNKNPFSQFPENGDWSGSSSSQQIVDARGTVLLNGGWQVPSRLSKLSGEVKNYLDYVSNDPTKTVEEIKALLETIRPDMEIPKEEREGTPEAMYYALMEHQRVGLTWLKKMEEGKARGGILADDMGLGKTIQTLALLVSRPSPDPKHKTTLIVAPVALLKQWEREIKKKLKKEHQLSVYIYHGGNKKAKTFADLAEYDVVLTTFGTVASEYKRKESYNRFIDLTEGGEQHQPPLMLLSEESKFYRMVIDEAQWIKNKDTQSSKGCWDIKAKYRLCLSGTPMQNSCDELFSLLRFLRVKPYNEWSTFSNTFSKPLKSKSQPAATAAMGKLQALLKAVLLRRTKSSEIDGKPILTLPSKTIEMVYAVFEPEEQAFYEALESKSKIVFNKYLTQNAVGRNYSNILVLLLRLRQACCHPHLINDIEEPQTTDKEAMLKLVRELAPEVVVRIKQAESLECPVCLDVSPNPSIVSPCGHLFCKECLLQVQVMHDNLSNARGEENSKLRCPGCRGEMDIKKITDLNTFKIVHPPEGGNGKSDFDDIVGDGDSDLLYDSDDDSDSDGEDADENDLDGFVVPDDDGADVKPKPKSKPKPISGSKSKPKNSKQQKKGKEKAKNGRTLAEVRKDAIRNEKSRKLYHKYLQKRWVDSAKISKCVDIITDIQEKCPDEKTIVFSQFTSLLDLLEIPILKKNISYRRYDGGMSAAKRNKSLNDFQDDPNIKVLLVSLKAGNSGLNLVAASQVIIFDPFYNPYIELQAIDRAHRIGQQRPVVVHRLVVAGTVEDRVLELQEKKKELIEGALDENAQRGLGRLTAKDLGFLFGI